MKKNILVILGTRPEAIKLAPLIIALQKSSQYKVLVCNTEQQKELSNQTLGFFGIKADFNLNVMQPNQTLAETQARILTGLSEVFKNNKIDATIVQGDTLTVFCGALVSFYNKIPLFHVEAGLRSYNLQEPFPEEGIRQMVTKIADLHFAPTDVAYDALLKENIAKNKIIMTGNTVIDALSCLSDDALNSAQKSLMSQGIVFNDKMVLITAHRRENHGERLTHILDAIDRLSQKFSDHQFIIPVHPNPNVHDAIYARLQDIKNVILLSPLSYPELVSLIKNTKLVMTDSGGIQEEAPTFKNPILILRYETERTEGIEKGFAKLVGSDMQLIEQEASSILSRSKEATRIDNVANPYGDGQASIRILEAMDNFFSGNKSDNIVVFENKAA